MRSMLSPIGIFTMFLIFSMSVSHADIPQVLNFQGKVTDTGGITVADGDYSMTFTIYDAETSGTSLWSSGAVSVSVSGGIFSILLGESPQPTLNLGFDIDYWLEVDIEGDVQSPRTPLGSVGYAYMTSGVVAGTEVEGTRSNPVFKGINHGTGAGLRGDSDQGDGVRGQSSATDGKGVYGVSTATTGSTYGGRFESSSSTYGRGVFAWAKGTTGQAVGVYGVSSSSSGYAVLGEVDATTGTNYGVYGRTNSSSGYGVFGEAIATTGTNYGVCGKVSSTSGSGIFGRSTAATGTVYGGRFESNSSTYGRGVFGWAKATSGETMGVYGLSSSPSGYGIFGEADATTGTNYAVYGETDSPDGYAGYFDGKGYFSGKVGIGTTSPNRKLSVVGRVRAANTQNEDKYVEIFHDDTDAFINWDGSSSDFSICYNGYKKMTIDRFGYVGIGTSEPTAKLHVQGGLLVNQGDFRVNEYGTPYLLYAGSGAVGIGTNDCPRTLTVNGDLGVNEEITVYESGAERARMGAYDGQGWVDTFGPNGEWNVDISTNTEHPNYGRVMVCDDESVGRAAIYINNNGVGEMTAGLKLFRIANPNQQGTEICYACIEGPEAAAYLRGTARLENGRASIFFPDHFRAVATEEGMTIQLTPRSAQSLGLAVIRQSVEGIEVRELWNGTGSYEFHYTVMAVRKGFEDYQVIQPAMDLKRSDAQPAAGA